MNTEQWHTGGNSLIVYDQNGWPVANAVTYHGKRRNDQQTARLIAAAPELLAALIEYVERHEQSCEPTGLPEYEKARAAIARATVE
jgi:hypothetical protein